jgi:hypothetical protein
MDETAQTGMLTLGWQLNNRLEPIYWLNKKAKAGGHSEEHLVRVPADMLAYHTAIVAQSGSGKSFFLGRLIEEIMLSTKARCVVLDPNADFRRVSEVVDTVRWKKAAYEKGRGHLPHEETAQKFIDEWKKIDVRVRVGPALGEGNYTRFKLPWMSLSVEIFSDDVDPTLRIELYHCHEFVRAVASLLLRKSAEIDIIDEAERIFDRIRDEPPRYRRHALEEEFGQTAGSRNPLLGGLLFLNIFGYRRSIDRAAAALGYVSPDTKRYYFGKAREYVAQDVVETKIRRQAPTEEKRARLDVVDLPSFRDSRTRLLALNSVLATIWESARKEWEDAIKQENLGDTRVPTFIVVDEAHNLIPVEQQGLAAETLKEQFRTIAAEGRKYGLFLIVCTQRPDKIDPRVLSECENKAIMRLGASSVLEKARQVLGLEDIDDVKKCLLFQMGRAILVGRWAMGESQLLYTAMRRTEEGGRPFRESFWATPPVYPVAEASETRPIATEDAEEKQKDGGRDEHLMENTLAQGPVLEQREKKAARSPATRSTGRKRSRGQ